MDIQFKDQAQNKTSRVLQQQQQLVNSLTEMLLTPHVYLLGRSACHTVTPAQIAYNVRTKRLSVV